jgi:hypothetical protein
MQWQKTELAQLVPKAALDKEHHRQAATRLQKRQNP